MGDNNRHPQPPPVFSINWVLEFVRAILTRDLVRVQSPFRLRMPEWRVISSDSSSESESSESAADVPMAPVTASPSKSTTDKPKVKICYYCHVKDPLHLECITCSRYCDEVCAWLYDKPHNPESDIWQCRDCFAAKKPIPVSMAVDPPATPPPRASSVKPSFPATPTASKSSLTTTPKRAASVMPFSSTPTVIKGVEDMSLVTPKSSKKVKKAAKEEGEKSKKRKNESKVESPIKRASTPHPVVKPVVVVNKFSSASKVFPRRSLSPSPIPSRSMSPTPSPAKNGTTAFGSAAIVKKENAIAKPEPAPEAKKPSQLSAAKDDKKNDELKSAMATILAHLPGLDDLRAKNSELQKAISELKDTVDSKENVIWELKEYNDNLQDKATEWEIKCGKLEDKLRKIRRLSTGAHVLEGDEHNDDRDDARDARDGKKDRDEKKDHDEDHDMDRSESDDSEYEE